MIFYRRKLFHAQKRLRPPLCDLGKHKVYDVVLLVLSPIELGQTLATRSEEIVAMWRFTRNNGITEGFHNKMELIDRQVYRFRNFENYRLRVKVYAENLLGNRVAPLLA